MYIHFVCLYFTAVYGVVRNRGNFGDVTVSWVVSPDFTQDVSPVQGTIFFGDQEFSKNIIIYSLPDEVNAFLSVVTSSLFSLLLFAFLSAGDKTQGLVYSRQVLLQLN
jgi:hypothetical protein